MIVYTLWTWINLLFLLMEVSVLYGRFKWVLIRRSQAFINHLCNPTWLDLLCVWKIWSWKISMIDWMSHNGVNELICMCTVWPYLICSVCMCWVSEHAGALSQHNCLCAQTHIKTIITISLSLWVFLLLNPIALYFDCLNYDQSKQLGMHINLSLPNSLIIITGLLVHSGCK